MMRLHCLQHEPFVGPGTIEAWAMEKGYTMTRTLFYEAEELPLLGSFDLLVIVGGTMGANDEGKFPWMAEEKRFIKKALATGKIVLGLCLGAQLLGSVLNGAVTKNPYKEIGWFPVCLTEEAKSFPVFSGLSERFMAFQWHGDTFSIPPGARRLASSEACPDQAFELGRAIGIQFHPEASKESIEGLLDQYGRSPAEGPYTQNADTIRAGYGYLEEQRRTMWRLLDNIDALLISYE